MISLSNAKLHVATAEGLDLTAGRGFRTLFRKESEFGHCLFRAPTGLICAESSLF